MRQVHQEGQKEEVARSKVSPAYNPSHGFRVNGVACEQHPSHPRSDGDLDPGEDLVSDSYAQVGGGAVEEDVDEMVAPWLKAAEEIVDAEGQDAQGPVGTMGAAVRQRSAPEVVLEEVVPWCGWMQIRIAQHCTSTIRHQGVYA